MAKSKELANKPNVFALLATKDVKGGGKLEDTGAAVSPYIQFAHPLSKNYAQMSTALKGLTTGTPVLVQPDGVFVKLEPFQFLATPAFYQCYGQYNDAGEVTATMPPMGRTPTDWYETIVAVVVLVMGNDLYPARCRFKGPKCPAVRMAIMAIQDQCEDPDFKSRGKDHAKVAASGLPSWAWLLHTANLQERTGKNSARPYHLCESVSALTPFGTLTTLNKLQASEPFAGLFGECLADYNAEVEKLEGLIRG